MEVTKYYFIIYINGAFLATAIMCGVSLESLIYKLTVVDKWKSYDGEVYAYCEDECEKKVCKKAGPCLDEALRKGIIDGSIKEKIEKIRKERNFAAHYPTKRDERVRKYILDAGRKVTSIPLGVYWITEDKDKAKEILEKTAEIIASVAERAEKNILKQEITQELEDASHTINYIRYLKPEEEQVETIFRTQQVLERIARLLEKELEAKTTAEKLREIIKPLDIYIQISKEPEKINKLLQTLQQIQSEINNL